MNHNRCNNIQDIYFIGQLLLFTMSYTITDRTSRLNIQRPSMYAIFYFQQVQPNHVNAKRTAFTQRCLQLLTISPRIHPFMHPLTRTCTIDQGEASFSGTPQRSLELGAGDQTSNLLVTSQPALSPELLPHK